jgi:hypothetical protein
MGSTGKDREVEVPNVVFFWVFFFEISTTKGSELLKSAKTEKH